MKGKHSTAKWLLVLIVVGGIGYLIYENPDSLFTGDVTDAIPTMGTGEVENQQAIQVYSGDITHTTAYFDTEDSTITYGDDTETATLIYKKVGGDYIRLTGATSADPPVSTIAVNESILTVYLEASIQSGQAYYVDASRAVTDNARVGNPLWLDLDKNNRKTYVFPIDVTGYNPDPNNTPTQSVQIALIDEGSIDVDSPAIFTGVSTGKVRNNIKWSADLDNSGDGEIVTRIRITFNSTDTGQWYPLDSSISWPNGRFPDSGTTKIYLNEFDSTQLTSTFQYDWEIGGGDVNEGHLFVSPLNGEQEFEVPVEVYSNLVTNAGLQVTLEIQTVDAQGAYTVNSDCVKLIEASTGVDC